MCLNTTSPANVPATKIKRGYVILFPEPQSTKKTIVYLPQHLLYKTFTSPIGRWQKAPAGPGFHFFERLADAKEWAGRYVEVWSADFKGLRNKGYQGSYPAYTASHRKLLKCLRRVANACAF